MNGGARRVQFAAAPLAAAYFHQPMVADLLRVQALSISPTRSSRWPRAAGPAARLQAPGADRPRRGGAQRGDRARPARSPGSACGPWSRRRRALVRAGGRLCRRRAALADPAALPLRGRRRDAPLRRGDDRGAGLLVRAEPGRHLHRRPRSRRRTARHLHDRPVPDPDPRRQVRAAAERGRLRRLFADPGAAGHDRSPPS